MKRTTKPAGKATKPEPKPAEPVVRDSRAYEPMTDKPIRVRALYSPTAPPAEPVADKPEPKPAEPVAAPVARELDPRAFELRTDKPIRVRSLYASTAPPTGSSSTRGDTHLSTGTTDEGA